VGLEWRLSHVGNVQTFLAIHKQLLALDSSLIAHNLPQASLTNPSHDM
jgi:hypothetical protein